MNLEIVVPGVPVPKGSWTRGRNGGFFPGKGKGKDAHYEWAHRLKSYAERSVHANHIESASDEPFAADLTFYMPRPKSASKRVHCSVKPDLDKLVRGVLDPMIGVVITEDSRMVQVTARKVYADSEFPVGVLIRLWSV